MKSCHINPFLDIVGAGATLAPPLAHVLELHRLQEVLALGVKMLNLKKLLNAVFIVDQDNLEY